MEQIKESLEKLSHAIKELEDSVEITIRLRRQNLEKIENLQTAIQTTYDQINDALNDLEEPESDKEEGICLSLP